MRAERIDVLRGGAVFGILLVNVWGFVFGYTTMRYGVATGPATVADQLAVFFVAAFAEQKFYPIFAFLFGAGFALSRRRSPLDRFVLSYKRRLQWLLACGLLHGSLLWLGDILSTYALAGFWLLGKAGLRLRALLVLLRRVAIVDIVVLLIVSVGHLLFPPMAQRVAESHSAFLVYTEGSWAEIAIARLMDYGMSLLNLFFFLPWVALFFLLGVVAVRLGPLVRPARHRRLWQGLLGWTVALALPLNLWWGYVAAALMRDPFHPPVGAEWAGMLVNLAGPALAVSYVAACMLASPAAIARVQPWLAPVGRLALSNYLMQSLLLMLLLQGFALGLGSVLSRAGLLGLCAAIMVGQLCLSR